MKQKIPFEECISDSPKFRFLLEDSEKDVQSLESRIERIARRCNDVVETGRNYCSQLLAFNKEVEDLSKCLTEDIVVTNSLHQFSEALKSTQQIHTRFISDIQTTVHQPFLEFISRDIQRNREHRRHFEEMSSRIDSALSKNASVHRLQATSIAESEENLTLAQINFKQASLDYVYHLNNVHCQKRYDVLSTFLKYTELQSLFFEDGYKYFEQFRPALNKISDSLNNLQQETVGEQQELEKRYKLAQKLPNDRFSHNSIMTNQGLLVMEGYLYKRGSGPIRPVWNRRYFYILNNQLIYFRRNKKDYCVCIESLNVCICRSVPDQDRRFCFEILSPAKLSQYRMLGSRSSSTYRSVTLQAASEQLMRKWLKSIDLCVSTAYKPETNPRLTAKLRTNPVSADELDEGADSIVNVEAYLCPSDENNQSPVLVLRPIQGNSYCCDCGRPDPLWAVINLGILVCIECSGAHRSLGVRYSKVRSLTLDVWEPEQIKLMKELGNKVGQNIFEHTYKGHEIARPTTNSNRLVREAWIQAKYRDHRFVKPITDQQNGGDRVANFNIDEFLFKAAGMRSVSIMLEALALGANVNYANSSGRTPLHNAVIGGSISCCEFLLQNGAHLNQQDAAGQTPLILATSLSHTGQVSLFLQKGANWDISDNEGQDAIQVALSVRNGDIVTLFRLAEFVVANNQRLPRDDPDVHAAFSDYTQRATDSPILTYSTQRTRPA